MTTPGDDETVAVPSTRPEPLGAPGAFAGGIVVDVGALSHMGNVRATNQDHFLVGRMSRSYSVMRSSLPAGEVPGSAEEFAYALVVADGMGGAAAGDRASLLAIRTGMALVLDSSHWAFKIDEEEARLLIDRMRNYFGRIDATLIRQGEADPKLAGMGTTLLVAYLVGSSAFIAHAGDSRAYLERGGDLRRLTRDHTLAQRLADLGQIRPEQVAVHSQRHVLTNYAGGPSNGIEPDVLTVPLVDGDRLLLCSDGLTGMVGDDEIAAILARNEAVDPAAQALVDRALERGGRDNVTVVVARYSLSP